MMYQTQVWVTYKVVWCGEKRVERELDKNCDKKLFYNNNDFDNKCIKSVQFRENWDLIALNMVKNMENTEN